MKELIIGSLLLSSVAMAQEVNLDKSEIKWEAKKVIGGGHNGTIKLKSASLNTKDKEIQSGIFEFDLTQIDVTDLQGEWRDKFLGHIKSPDFFNVEVYPKAILKLDNAQGNEASGYLTIKDKTNPIKIVFKREDNTYSGIVHFDRTKYDMIYGSNNFFKNLGDKAIAHDVKVEFKIVLK